MSRTPHNRPSAHQLKGIAYAVGVLCASMTLTQPHPAWAAATQIDDEPLATRPTVKAKPNLMVVLDDSGSMSWSWMPDSLGYYDWNYGYLPYSNWYGYRSAQCNGVAYDPSVTYTPPKKYDGSTYLDAAYPKALNDGYNSSSGTTDLSTDYYYTYSGTQTKMGWKYTVSGGTTPTNDTFYKECASVEGNTPGKSVFTKVSVSGLTTAQKTNYANWYSFYRKRYLLMRTAMGRAMAALDDSYRVGFSTIHEGDFTDGGSYKFLGVSDFTSGSTGQKNSFYASLYGVSPSGGTPLRQALANTGRYYANQISGQTDPMQYSCQRNYALLTTDGYWNGENGAQLDGSAIGQQDGLEDRPMRDDASVSTGTITVYTATATRDITESFPRSRPVSYTRTVQYWVRSGWNWVLKSGSQTASCSQSGSEDTVTHQSGKATYSKTVAGGSTSYTDIVYSDWVNTSTDATTYSAGSVGSCTYSPNYNNIDSATAWSSPTYGSWTTGSTSTSTESNVKPSSRTDSGFVAGTPKSTVISTGGTSDTLADVAEYYWKTDLRTSTLGNCSSSASGSSKDVCNNIVPTSTQDPAAYQHMNTFTIGLGVSGTLTYDKNYLTQTSGTYVDLKSGTTNWPSPSSDAGPVNIDDLWHAAVNGRGQYYSALDATSLNEAISGVINSIQRSDGASSAAATSSLELVAGDNNRLYRASYTTAAWTGDLVAYKLTGSTAAVSSTSVWSAQSLLDGKTYTDRKIYFNKSGTLTAFNYSNLPTAQQAYFDNLCSKTVVSGQCSTLTTADKTKANTGDNLVNYLRGERTYESATTVSGTAVAALYRKREHLLGDIINGAPVYVGKPPFSYSDEGYSTFKATSRDAMIYTASNDGMLHAFDAATGEEKWAFIPSAVMPNLYKLADNNYASKHQYFVDGAPVMGDIKVSGAWKTILVGGLNKGGKAYYALDITDPTSPKVLWEFTHTNLGYTFGNPVITKNAAGTWVVAFASGYNNYDSTTSTGDGVGRLFIVNAATGAEIISGGIATSAGSTGTPSGLAKINAWVEDAANNTAKRFYGGDLLGNIWRFDHDGLVEPKKSALKLGVAQISSTTPQPITTKPMLIQASNKPVVLVGTGRYLGEGDITDTTQQSIYAIKDPLTNDSWGDIRTNSNFVKQTLTAASGATTASITATAVDWSTQAGWWVDLPHSKERVSTPMALQLTTLVIPTTIPSGDACASGGSSWLYYLNATTGGAINKNPVGTQQSDHTLLVGTNWVRDSDGNIRMIVQGSDGTLTTVTPPVTGSTGTGAAHRTSWRELVD
ncbi:MAG: pilus assembly protein [Aquabacterium sp.]|uniref:pilus assembly protein n=1 Tax=Aquabacterium sp. TaxID=1872578 RepID=UPI003BE65CBC